MIARALCEAAFRDAVLACDPAARVREALARAPAYALPAHRPAHAGAVIGLAIGKAAVAMARGAGPVTRGLIVAPAAPAAAVIDAVPEGWSVLHAAHPLPDATSFAAGARVLELVSSAGAGDVVLALISGGASALVEQPREGMSADEYRERVRAVMDSGAPIHELNRVRTELSALKGGKLAACSAAPVVTLVVSDVIGDDPRVIGSGPTIADPAALAAQPARARDRVEVVAPMAGFGEQVALALAARGVMARRIAEPIADDVAAVAARLVAELPGLAAGEVLVAWGEPTVRVVDNAGRGGRAQQLALELARRVRGTARSALVAGSDGIDGPSARAAAGGYVDGSTWDAILAASIDPVAALARCDAGTALDAVGALFVTGPTGINHADVVILG